MCLAFTTRSMNLKLTKMHGCGNDMLMIDNREGTTNLNVDQIKKLCDRHFGIGADGLILLESSNKADCFMNYYNSDGTLAEMCGNGIRCTADFYCSLTNDTKKKISIDTRAGMKEIEKVGEHEYKVDMGTPVFESKDFGSEKITLCGFDFYCVSFGNPHAVAFVDSIEKVDIKEIGPAVERHEFFPNRVNVSFVQVTSRDHIKVSVWERGCGQTLACGTAACASFTIAKKEGRIGEKAAVELPGGVLTIEEKNGRILMSGPAEVIFSTDVEM